MGRSALRTAEAAVERLSGVVAFPAARVFRTPARQDWRDWLVVASLGAIVGMLALSGEVLVRRLGEPSRGGLVEAPARVVVPEPSTVVFGEARLGLELGGILPSVPLSFDVPEPMAVALPMPVPRSVVQAEVPAAGRGGQRIDPTHPSASDLALVGLASQQADR